MDQTTLTANHTPGPWINGCHGGGWHQITVDDTGTPNERTDDVSNLWILANVNDCMGDESAANARLISAAPDLLSEYKLLHDRVCEMVQAMRRKGLDGFVADWLMDGILDGDAITKATGE